MIELRIGGRAVDISPDTQITLEFNSNLFGDISEITASNSMTISLPKTPTNNQVFGLPSVIGGMTSAPYSKLDAEMYVNGVQVVSTAYAVLLSVGESYEISLYWGVAKALSTLKDNDKTLKDIAEVLSIQYGGENWWTDWEGKVGKDENGNGNANLINAVYECGIPDLRNDMNARAQVALLPSVRVSWVWRQVLRDNGLSLIVPQTLNLWLAKLAIPFTTHKISVSDSNHYAANKFSYARRGYEALLCLYGGTPIDKGIYSIKPIYTDIELDGKKYKHSTIGFRTTSEGMLSASVNLSFYAGTVVDNATICFAHYSENGELLNEYTQFLPGASSSKEGNLNANVEMGKGEYVVCYVRMFKLTGFDKSATERATLTLHNLSFSFDTEGAKDQAMGGIINTRDNLPEIKQLDFVKDICAMQGLWPTLIGGNVHLVSYADFYNGAQPTLDWSHKLVGSGDSDAPQISYTLGNVAQRNILTYAEDDSVKTDASATLYVDNDNLEQEQDMFELQFAASDDNVIPHYKMKEAKEGEAPEVEEEDVEPRIMEITSSVLDTTATLNFGSLSWSNLIANNYKYWQKLMRNPIVIEEQMWLTEVDIKELDYRKPIYLQKYGARFAVQKVQWSEGEPSSVTLVYLPPMNDIAVALPYTVTTGVAYVEVGVGEVVDVDPIPSLSYLVSGKGEYFAESATIRFDESAGAREQLKFKAWVSPAGRTISTENPYIYDGTNGDLEIIALTEESLVIG